MLANDVSVSDWEDPDAELSAGEARTKLSARSGSAEAEQVRSQLLAAYGCRCAVTGETARAAGGFAYGGQVAPEQAAAGRAPPQPGDRSRDGARVNDDQAPARLG